MTNAYAVVYRNEGREAELARIDALIGRYWNLAFVEGSEGREYDTPDGDAQHTLSKLQAAIAALSQPYTLHTLCNTPECAVESISPFEGAEVFGMATIAVESEPVSGMRYRVRAMAESECGTCEPEGVFTTEGHGPFDCYACGKKATTLREAAAAGITDHQRRMRGTNPGSAYDDPRYTITDAGKAMLEEE